MHDIEAEDFTASADRDPSRGGRVAPGAKIAGWEPELPAAVAFLDHQAPSARAVEKLPHLGGDCGDGFAEFCHCNFAYI
jgi:hypothetical protein